MNRTDYLYIAIIVILLGAAGSALLRLWSYRKQIRHITEELSMLEKEDTNYRLSSYCRIGQTEEMIEAVNGIIEKYRKELTELKRENSAYRESITSISHDIRTPLTTAKGYVQMMQRTEPDEKKRQEYVDIVERRLEDLNGMLNQLFEYARIEAGEMELVPEQINAGNLFAEILSMFYDDFAEKGCEPRVEITRIPCFVLADRQALKRVVENLIKNSLVHGNGNYRMSLVTEEEKVVMRVSNMTDSIEEKDLEHIFDRFYTTDCSRSRRTTGLGLAIVRKFVTQMGGEVKASMEGRQFTITVLLPSYPASEAG